MYSYYREEKLDAAATSRVKLAQSLEKYLYKNAPSFEAYSDKSTVDMRLRLVAVALLSRRRDHHKISRRRALQTALGNPKYQQVCDLVKAVQDLRLRGAPSCRCTTACCKKIDIPGQRVMPPAVRSLFFHTDIVEAATTTPVEQAPFLQWDAMIHQARDNIQAYQDWSGLKTKYVQI